jgi:hypothetical protein
MVFYLKMTGSDYALCIYASETITYTEHLTRMFLLHDYV